MQVLVLHDDTKILGWLVGESIESAPDHIAHGYQALTKGYAGGTVKATVLEIPEKDTFNPAVAKIDENRAVLATP